MNLAEIPIVVPMPECRMFRVGNFIIQGHPDGRLYSARPYDPVGAHRTDGDAAAMLRDLAVTLRKLADEADAIASETGTESAR